MLPPDEWHEIGLLFSNYILRAKSLSTIYLGQNVPFDNVSSVLKLCKATHVLMFIISRRQLQELKNLRKLMGLTSNVQLLIAGNPEMTALITTEKDTKILNNPSELLNYI